MSRVLRVGPWLSSRTQLTVRCATTSSQKKSVAAAEVQPVEQPESHLSAEDDRLPDGRRYVGWKGKKYPFPWRGEVEENFSPALINKWVAEGKWDPVKNRPVMFLKNTHEKMKIWQMYYALQAKQGIPVYKMGPWDHNINIIAMMILPFITLVIFFYNCYHLLMPKERLKAYKYRFVNGRAEEFGEKVHHD